MPTTQSYGVISHHSPVAPLTIERRPPGPHDVAIDIHYCGICHSDIHQARNEWESSTYPMVPGHEIVGVVRSVGKKVKKFKPGMSVGVGCMVDSCHKCSPCKDHEEQFCEKGAAFTYNSTEMDRTTPTQGGYSQHIVVHQDFVLKVQPKQPLERVAPLLCAGITTYSPLKRAKIRQGHRVAVVGLGGLGHMGVKIAKAMGAEVTVISTSPSKAADAKKLGAKHFLISKDPEAMTQAMGRFDFILDTVSAPHDLNALLGLLKRDGKMVLVGVPTEAAAVDAFSLIGGRKQLSGSLIGGIKETQEMLDFCAKKKIFAEVEVIPPTQINEAFERTIKSQVRYRFVIDLRLSDQKF